MHKTAILIAAVIGLAAAASPAVIRIPGDYMTLQAAVDAASDGDILIIDPKVAFKEDVVIDNKGIHLAAEYALPVKFLSGRIEIMNLAPGKTVVLEGIQSEAEDYPNIEGLLLSNNQGSVRVENCTIVGRTPPISMASDDDGGPGARIHDCTNTAFTRSTIMGGGGGNCFFGYPAGDGAAGIDAKSSEVALYDCHLEGGGGGGGDYYHDAGDGGDGTLSDSALLFASGSVFRGGNGGGNSSGTDGSGGDGLHLEGISSLARLLDNTYQGGEGGSNGKEIVGNTVLHLKGTARKLHMPSPVGENAPVTLTFEGKPGDLAALLFSLNPGGQFIPGLQGQLLLGTAPFPILVFVGNMPSGSMIWHGFIPDQGPGFIAAAVYIQSIFLDAGGDALLGSPRSMILLDETYAYLPKTIHVPKDHNTIQEAIDASKGGDTILVAPGTYHENLNFHGNGVTMKSTGGPSATVIDGGYPPHQYWKSVVVFNTKEGRDSVIEGFTLTNGAGTWLSHDGGGIYCVGASPSIRNNIIADNYSDYRGGGIYLESSSAEISGNIIAGNEAKSYGGGIYGLESSPEIRNNIISKNHATLYFGGGLALGQCEAEVAHCTITENSTGGDGGGLSCFATSLNLRDTILWNNMAAGVGKEMHIHFFYPPDPSTVALSFSDLEGGAASIHVEAGNTLDWGAGMIDADPLFIVGPFGDYYLSQDPVQPGINNPCVDSGSELAGILGMGSLWTRTDEVPDSGIADMGFHHGPK